MGNLAIVLRIIVCVSGVSFYACGPVVKQNDAVSMLHSDSGISRPSYESIVNTFKGHEQKNGTLVEYFEYGRSYQDRPLMGIKVWDKKQRSGNIPAVLISEAIHGDEYLNITDRLPGELLGQSSLAKFLDKGGIVYFIPIINPDGFSSGRRENSRGADLNRDFSNAKANFVSFKQVETKSVADFIAAEKNKHNFTLEVSMEYHCCIGGLIHPNAFTKTPLPASDLTRHQEIGSIVQRKFKKGGRPYAVGTVHTMLSYPETFGGSDDYYFHTYGRRAFSFEGNFQVERTNLPLHVDMWNEIFEIAGAPYEASGGNTTQVSTNAPSAYLAVGSDLSDGTTLLYAAASSDAAGVALCVGKAEDCGPGGDGKRVALSLTKSEGGVKYYKTSVGVAFSKSGTNYISVISVRESTQSVIATASVSAK